MVNLDLERSWACTRKLLALAVEQLPLTRDGVLDRYREWLDHNELELAMDELDAIGDAVGASGAFFSFVAQAAANMGLKQRHDEIQAKVGPTPN